MSAHGEGVRVIWVEHLHHEAGGEGGELLDSTRVNLGEVDPVLSDDPISGQ